MSKKKPALGLRKPPAPVDPIAAARFVRGAPTASSPSTPHHNRAIVTRANGRELRRMTIYLAPELAKRVAVHAARLDADVSVVVAQALEVFLEGVPGE